MTPSQYKELERQADVIERDRDNKKQWDWETTKNRYVSSAKNFSNRYGYKDVSDHIIDIMVSIMMTRDKVMEGGSFVRAICDNNLKECISYADGECINYIRLLSLTYSFCHIQSNGL